MTNKKQNYFFQNALSWSRIKSGNKQKTNGSLSFLPAIQIGSCFDALATNPSFIYKGMLFNESENVLEELDPNVLELCKDMYESLCNSDVWKDFLALNPSFQTEGFSTYEVNGITIKIKGKLDGHVPKIVNLDLKTTKETTSEAFLKAMNKLDYVGQLSYYNIIIPVERNLCIGVSKTPPHEVFSYQFNTNSEVDLVTKQKIHRKITKLPNLEMYQIDQL